MSKGQLTLPILTVLFLLGPSTVSARDRVLKPGRPSEVGLSASKLGYAGSLLEEETKSGAVLAASILVARQGKIVFHHTYGRMGASPDSAPAHLHTRFSLASITKPFTVAALMALVDQGKVTLWDPVQKYLPEFQGKDHEKVRVKDLLTHTSGLPDMLPENQELRDRRAPLAEFTKRAMTTPLLFTPGTQHQYQSMGILLAAVIVERIGGSPLPDVFERSFFKPLGMKLTTLGLRGHSLDESAPIHSGKPSPTDPAPNRDYREYWANLGIPWGGMHSTTGDVAIYLQMLLNGGVYNKQRIFSIPSVVRMTTNQNGPSLAPWALGWKVNMGSREKPWFGDLASPEAFGHTGATGTMAFADPSTEMICVILTTRSLSFDDTFLLRRTANAVMAAIEN
jgi:CubicO group peptidase (beta-lactamase class C family)